MLNKEELMVSESQFCWNLNVDILVLEELSLHQLDYMALGVRAAILNL